MRSTHAWNETCQNSDESQPEHGQNKKLLDRGDESRTKAGKVREWRLATVPPERGTYKRVQGLEVQARALIPEFPIFIVQPELANGDDQGELFRCISTQEALDLM